LKAANEIVPVALDLGIVQLNRAQSLKDPAARKSELEAAEKTFLAIRGFAGETDEYRLFLGQVYYWLGKSKEGKELFDQLLASRKRAYATLMALGHTLRSVGETAEARALAEEAYKSAKKDDDRYNAASFRSLLFKDEDDQIAWLEKADPAATWNQIQLNYARGTKALEQGNKTLAASLLRKAISGYDSLAKSSTTLNNCGLAYSSLYEATSNPDDLKRGMTLMEEAIALDPSDSILLNNTMYFLITRAVMDVLKDSIHTEVLGRHVSIQTLAHLYRNEQERALIYQQLRDNEAMKKALSCLDKALLLAPKSLSLYSTAFTLQGSFRDVPELQKLHQRFLLAAPDGAESRDNSLLAYGGSKDKEYLQNFQTEIKTLNNALQLPAVAGHVLTVENVNVRLLNLQQNACAYGGTADSQKLLQIAEATFQKHASSATHQALISAYLFRASEELKQQNPQFATLVDRTRRALGPEYLFAFIVERGGPLSELVKKNPNFLKALALEKESVANFPAWGSINEWALLRASDPETANVIAERVKKNEAIRLVDQIQFELNPLNASAVLEQYWTQKLLGDEKRGLEIYQTASKGGVPLPPL
jgi:tetratricopeptide (TPR) repeat protein